MKELSDADLLLQLKEGNQVALGEIYDRFWKKLFVTAYNRLQNVEEAEECVQDVFLKLWDSREFLPVNFALSTILAVACRNKAINIFDKRFRLKRRMKQYNQLSVVAPAADEQLLISEMHSMLEVAVKALPEKCQIVYRMSREEGKSSHEIAQVMGTTVRGVNKHLARAVDELKGGLAISTPVILLLIISELL